MHHVWGVLLSHNSVDSCKSNICYELNKPQIVIGRSSRCDIRVQHHQVSARHVLLEHDPATNTIRATDKSSNGTILRQQGSNEMVSSKMTKDVPIELVAGNHLVVVKTGTSEISFELRSCRPEDNENNHPLVEQSKVTQQPTPVSSAPVQIQQPEATRTLPVVEALPPTTDPCTVMPEATTAMDDDLPDFDAILGQKYDEYEPPTSQPQLPQRKPKSQFKVVEFPRKKQLKRKPSLQQHSSSTSSFSVATEMVVASKKPALPIKNASSTSDSRIAVGEMCHPDAIFSARSETSIDIQMPLTASLAPPKPRYNQFQPVLLQPTNSQVGGSKMGQDDDDDELPDIIPDFKPPPSVAQLRAPSTSADVNLAPSSSETSSTQISHISAADRARKAMAASMPDHYFDKDKQPSTSGGLGVTGQTEGASDEEEEDEMAENLQCTICQEIYHDPVNITPCNHTFCAGCLSLWLAKGSHDCPQCRGRVEKTSEYHLIKSIVEIYLKKHPDKKRNAAELEELDKNNTITRKATAALSSKIRGGKGSRGAANRRASNTLTFRVSDHTDLSDDFSSDNTSSSDEFDSDDDSDAPSHHHGGGFGFADFLHSALGSFVYYGASSSHPRDSVCRQCPGGELAGVSNISHVNTNATVGRGRGSGSSSTCHLPAPTTIVPFTCSNINRHVKCHCCKQCFPDCTSSRCVLCYRNFCHPHWGCRATSCLGCLGPVENYSVSVHEIEGGIAIKTNVFEAQVMASYLANNSVPSWRVIEVGLQLLQLDSLPELQSIQNQSSLVCRSCFQHRVLVEMAYAFRSQLTTSDLPRAVTSRENCRWGNQCRTQKHSVAHARKYNHICMPIA